MTTQVIDDRTPLVPRAVFRLAANQSIANSVEAVINWAVATVDVNVGPLWVSGSPGRFTVPTGQDGLYLIIAQLAYAANAGGTRRVTQVRLNGAYLNTYEEKANLGASVDTEVLASRMAVLAAGDYIEIYGYQNSGGAINILSASSATFVSMARID